MYHDELLTPTNLSSEQPLPRKPLVGSSPRSSQQTRRRSAIIIGNDYVIIGTAAR
jgi:hypothetical protein